MKNPTRAKSWNSKSWRERLDIHSGSKICINEIAVRHGRVPAPAKAGRPDSYGHGRERGMKVALPGAELRLTPQHYQRLVRKVVGKPEERIVSYLMLRSLKQARYAAEPLGHFALGFDEYTHFTSPIRRYPDLSSIES
jgi:ribonuclease R